VMHTSILARANMNAGMMKNITKFSGKSTENAGDREGRLYVRKMRL
jgi:hypothetical protein